MSEERPKRNARCPWCGFGAFRRITMAGGGQIAECPKCMWRGAIKAPVEFDEQD